MPSAYAIRRRVDNAYLVRERDRRRLRELLWVVVLLVPLAAGLLANIWIHVQVYRAGYRIHQLERQAEELTRSERQLQLEAAYLASPERIEQRATHELGMRPPKADQIVFLPGLQ